MAAAPPTRRLYSRRRLLVVLCFVAAFSRLMNTAGAQTFTTNATTDPLQARALNAMFQRWGRSATSNWNISGELCSGVAIDGTAVGTLNPGIKCDCSYNNRSTCHITALRVYALDVAGPIPDELWNLTYLTDLSFGINALSGELPAELGLLTDLRSLAFGTNNFSGPLPSELGNLSRLTQLYFDSAGVTGLIPLSFANLRSLEKVWASDNDLTGPIPDFIGNWSNLIQIRFQGNSFQGSIPPSFSNLTSLNDLRISDLSNGNFSLDFVRNMNSLATLVLRNNDLSGSIPSYFGELQSLFLLDLSFNNLTGRIPDSLFNHSVLTHLFLGNNQLTGSLPSQKSQSLGTIDLSYNELSGSFPSWVSTQNLQLNLVANNFSIDNSNSSALPSGLGCLQRNFPCNRGSPIYSRFAVKCGGLQITSADQIVYETDNATLGLATYYMTPTGRWAVSNVGLPADSRNPAFRSSSSSQSTNTVDSELFQTARISAGSLRYYGLGLENGNYTVTLQFAEIQIEGTRTWKSFGRRVFDIYIQISSPLLQINLRVEKNRTGLVAGIVVAVAAAIRVLILTQYHTFTYAELRTAADDFNDKLGEGGFGPVYKGTLADGRVVAVKQLSISINQGKRQFLAEIANTVKRVKAYISTGHAPVTTYAGEYLERPRSLNTLLRGRLTEKADIFSFGVVALEIISGRPNSDPVL
ncbi:UNVERIFIED_CONTAM: putative LRR receptor-like serine/threonine-protein kinase [Sesamum radiatum]|uniref:non-specific serine/threonine protein kinase n=1 Tax=Sesamum radiatum TaxID=300843 RepID=A0AAW2LTD1_SESRA